MNYDIERMFYIELILGDDIITSYEFRNDPMFLRNQFKGVGMFQYHPVGGHHGGAYYKISSGAGSTVRYDLFGNIL